MSKPSEEFRESRPQGRRALLFGGGGMLGWEVVEGLSKAGFKVEAPSRQSADIVRPESIRRVLERDLPGVVINCAAYTAVDRAETEREAAFAVNRDGPAHLAAECARFGLPLIHISTDYIFNGQNDRPYKETDPPGPLNAYGLSKWEGEEAIRSALAEHIILRTSWLYGVRGSNFVKTILRAGREREELRVVSDQHGCPTWTRDLAGAIVRVAGLVYAGSGYRGNWGAYHFCGRGITTWYAFTLAILERARQHESLKVQKVHPVPTTEYPTPAARPRWSVLDCRKIEEKLGISPPPWEVSLGGMLEELGITWVSPADVNPGTP